MTLLATEFLFPAARLDQGLIVFAADRRLTYTATGDAAGTSQKIFPIEGRVIRGGLGFFGLAQVGEARAPQPMAAWLESFIRGHRDAPSLEAFSRELTAALNAAMSSTSGLANSWSGFHLAGFNAAGLPELWFVRNMATMNGFDYRDFQASYWCTEDFLSRDAKKLGYDGLSPTLNPEKNWVYRNGDIRAHAFLFDDLDTVLAKFATFPDFVPPATLAEYLRYIKTKFRIAALLYEAFCSRSVIGEPIDAFAVRSDGRIELAMAEEGRGTGLNA